MSLKLTHDSSEIKCPHCEKAFGVKWDNEYADPEVGIHTLDCLECNKRFEVEVSVTFSKTWKV
jgi:transcription elongation factor Elf1